MKLTILILISFAGIHPAMATNLFLSARGNDQQDGKSKATAWRSLSKLSEVMTRLQPGDSVWFERGSIFYGQVSVSTSGIYLGAYGTGPNPQITGSRELHHWQPIDKNVWRASCDEEPANVFINGKFQPLGRYPNKGYLTQSGTSNNKATLSDTSLNFTDGYWNKAEVVVKSSRWTLDNLPVANFSQKTFEFSVPASSPLQKGIGYFIQKHLSTLDRVGEWFYDGESKQIFLFLDPGTNPELNIIEVSTNDTGLSANYAPDVTIENLAFTNHRLSGVTIKNCSNFRLLKIEIDNSGKNGLEISGCEKPLVDNVRITNSSNNGVEWYNNLSGAFTHCTILRTGLHAGRGMSGDGTYIALHITADTPASFNRFQYNTIDSTGYTAIDFRTGHTLIKNNYITNFCITKDDGGGVYTWNNAKGNNIVEGNIILNGIGSGEGTSDASRLFASGIYIDDRSSDILLKNNTLAHSATAGIFIHNANNITLIGNTAFANGTNIANKEKGQLYIRLDTLLQRNEPITWHLRVTQNKWVATDESSYCVYLSADRKQDLHQLGSFVQNEFSAHHPLQALAEVHGDSGLCLAPEVFTLKDWQTLTGTERSSSFTSLHKGSYQIIGDNMIRNGNMTLGTRGWMNWPDQTHLAAENKILLDGPSLRVIVSPGGTQVLLYQTDIAVVTKKIYRLSFSVRCDQSSRLEFVLLMAGKPWHAISDYTCFSMGPVRKTFTYFFRAEKNWLQARVNFKAATTFWIDSVLLHEVVENKDLEEVQLLYHLIEKSRILPLNGNPIIPGEAAGESKLLPDNSPTILHGIKASQSKSGN